MRREALARPDRNGEYSALRTAHDAGCRAANEDPVNQAGAATACDDEVYLRGPGEVEDLARWLAVECDCFHGDRLRQAELRLHTFEGGPNAFAGHLHPRRERLRLQFEPWRHV